MAASDSTDALIELAAECSHDPLGWAMAAFEWGRGNWQESTGRASGRLT